MPVIAATRAVRDSASATCPLTPALRRTIDETSATDDATTTRTELMSLTGRGSMTNRPM
jgi:hypothetical protein